MRTAGRQPRILLTNVKQLELLLTRQQDIQLFADARLDYLVFDEAHTFTGALGAETACLVRRLRAFCGVERNQTTCVATSATIVDDRDPEAARSFAGRFFGVPADAVMTVGEDYEQEVWAEPRFVPADPGEDAAPILDRCVLAVDEENDPDTAVRAAYRALSGDELPQGDWPECTPCCTVAERTGVPAQRRVGSPKSTRRIAARTGTARRAARYGSRNPCLVDARCRGAQA